MELQSDMITQWKALYKHGYKLFQATFWLKTVNICLSSFLLAFVFRLKLAMADYGLSLKSLVVGNF